MNYTDTDECMNIYRNRMMIEFVEFVFKYANYKYMLIYIHRQNRCLDIG